MLRDIKEADWKVLRRLHPVALARFCERVLTEIEAVRQDPARSYHQRYLDIFAIVERRDREMAQTFDDLRRSNGLMMLGQMRALELLREEELATLSAETRDFIDMFLRNRGS